MKIQVVLRVKQVVSQILIFRIQIRLMKKMILVETIKWIKIWLMMILIQSSPKKITKMKTNMKNRKIFNDLVSKNKRANRLNYRRRQRILKQAANGCWWVEEYLNQSIKV